MSNVIAVVAMWHQTRRLGLLVILPFAMLACDSRLPIAPTSPGPTPGPTTSSRTYTLSGVVSEITTSGTSPVPGASVKQLSSGAEAITDEKGAYSIAGSAALGPVQIVASVLAVTKDGFLTASKTVATSDDLHVDFQLVRAEYHTLSGAVFEITAAGRVPVTDVEVYCDSCGSPEGHTFEHTDGDGNYRFGWTVNGVHPLIVTKAGYAIVESPLAGLDRIGRIIATVQGDTQFDIELVRH